MTLAVFWAWVMANEASLATILLVISEILGSSTKIKANGFVSFILIQIRSHLTKKGAVDPTPDN
tara:strand:+ start:348 stop:539 length:192 start_codon:yes stop_codon:yes gene_type:complete